MDDSGDDYMEYVTEWMNNRVAQIELVRQRKLQERIDKIDNITTDNSSEQNITK